MTMTARLKRAAHCMKRAFIPRFEIRLTYGQPSTDPDQLAAQTLFRLETNRTAETFYPGVTIGLGLCWLRVLDRDAGRVHQIPMDFSCGPFQDCSIDLTKIS